MLSLLKTKLALLIQTKAGLALVGAVLVAGGGTAVVVTAGHNGLGPLGSTLSGPSASSTENDQGDTGDKNHVSAEGILTVYTTTSTGATISVQTKDNGTLTFAVDAHTRINGEHNGEHNQANGQKDQSDKTGQAESTTQSEATDPPESNGRALTLADLAKAVKHKVQVQGVRQQDNSLLATKVTIQGADSQTQNEGDNEADVQGSVASVGSTSFVLTTTTGQITVDVSAKTEYKGGLTGLSSVSGRHVTVQGVKQTDGSILASVVEQQEVEGTEIPEGTQVPEGAQTPEHG